MKIYLNGSDVVTDLHKKGFTNDFHLLGNDLLWVQEKCLVRVGEFDILEYHKIIEPKKNSDGYIVFGILAPYHNVKGILIKHHSNNNPKTSPIILKKLNDLVTCSPEHRGKAFKGSLNY